MIGKKGKTSPIRCGSVMLIIICDRPTIPTPPTAFATAPETHLSIILPASKSLASRLCTCIQSGTCHLLSSFYTGLPNNIIIADYEAYVLDALNNNATLRALLGANGVAITVEHAKARQALEGCMQPCLFLL